MGTMKRFWDKVDKTPGHGPQGKCWKWTAGTFTRGYGCFWLDGRMRLAHRCSWGIAYGKPPDDLCVLHTCDNPPCVNPSHLFLGTDKDNTRDMFEKGRQNRVKGMAHPRCKLTENQVKSIYNDSRRHSQIAEDYGIHQTQISRIKRGVSWAHLQGKAAV